jgi:thioredoxin-related protein
MSFKTWFAYVAMLWAMLAPAGAQTAELLMFESPGCPWCKRWHAEVGPGYPRSEEGKRAPLRIVPLERSSTGGVALASPVGASPTFVLVNQGKEVGRIVGYPGADFFWPMLAELIGKMDKAKHSKTRWDQQQPKMPQFACLSRISVVRDQT